MEFQALSLLISIMRPEEANVSAFKAMAFWSQKSYVIEAAEEIEESHFAENRSEHSCEPNEDNTSQIFLDGGDSELRLFAADDGYNSIVAGNI